MRMAVNTDTDIRRHRCKYRFRYPEIQVEIQIQMEILLRMQMPLAWHRRQKKYQQVECKFYLTFNLACTEIGFSFDPTPDSDIYSKYVVWPEFSISGKFTSVALRFRLW